MLYFNFFKLYKYSTNSPKANHYSYTIITEHPIRYSGYTAVPKCALRFSALMAREIEYPAHPSLPVRNAPERIVVG